MYNSEKDKEIRRKNNEKMFKAFCKLQKKIEKEENTTDETMAEINQIAKKLDLKNRRR